MKAFVSYAQNLKKLLTRIVAHPKWHGQWINTLSFLENCGARKIAACEHPTLVKEEMLKHAAEEFRHAHHLKRQMEKLSLESMETYSSQYILGGFASLHYLERLDVQASRYLLSLGLSKNAIKEAAYLLVTYAIELRAGELYPVYDEILRKSGSRVVVKSILLEEKEHLLEMESGIRLLPEGFAHAQHICALEGNLCGKWVDALEKCLKKESRGDFPPT